MANQSIAATATVIAALFAAGVSFLHLTLTKEQKISDFRQAWIDALREDLATFFSVSRAMARATEEQRLPEAQKAGMKFAFSEDQVREYRLTVAQTYYRIKLRLNSGEAEHIQLLSLMDQAIAAQIAAAKGESDGRNTLPAIESAVAYSRPLLKSEWDRVKRGEPNFRVARNWIPPILVILAIAFCLILQNV
ncbi:MAG: hypothetical protein HXX12_08895 [Geothrix sp.]|uniref:hypothetical protein n=1 Tax=Geothrix sp. TaxID=1962974 RepID=UPI0017DE75B0|nr:hypothetical protein [Geothrix sp.]NWJ41071.1 hypothetical protein [Geothrix sp.]WIL20937.1 MAG: hypothetical protein QOZ81_000172 [Geothrix sp.]